jgi:uncharacterized protein (TIGR02186 family)
MTNRMSIARLCSVLATAAVLIMGAAPGISVFYSHSMISAKAQTPPKKKQKSQKRKPEATDVKTDPPPPVQAVVPPVSAPPPAPLPLEPERVEADVSTRSIAVTSGYSGAEIVVFGTVENSRQSSAESGYYDVIVIVEGAPAPLVARKKSRVAGLWINTSSLAFNSVPGYYAMASTRPVEEFADASILDELAIGFERVRMVAAGQPETRVSSDDLFQFKSAVARLKERQSLFLRDDYGVAFSGRSLFRSTIQLPANVPVGPLTTRVYLFQDGKLLSRYQSRVSLAREGVERWLHDFAFGQPVLYGIFTVLLALAAGVLASALFRRRAI